MISINDFIINNKFYISYCIYLFLIYKVILILYEINNKIIE